MAREETIQIKIDKSLADKPLQELKSQAESIKNTFANIKVGDASNALNQQAAAARQSAAAARANAQAQTAQANAAAANLRVQREQVNLANAQQRTVRDLNATQAEAARLQREHVNLNNARQRSIRDLTATQAEQLRLQQAQVDLDTALIRQQNTINNGNRQYATALRNLGNAIGQVNQNRAQDIQYMAQYIRQQNDLGNAQVTATGAIRNAAGAFQTYRAAVSGANGVTHNYRVAVNTATGEVYRLDQGIRTTSVSLRNISSIMRSVQTIVGFTGVAQSMRYALSEMKSMSDEMVTYRKVTGATAQEMERIRSSAYATAKQYGQTPSDFLASASEMARAGYGENSVAMAELATKTQLVGDMTAEAASKFLLATDAGYKYQGNIEQLTAVLDAANEVDNNFATSIEKISEGMTLVASLAGSVHVPVEQLIAALGTMTATTQRSGAEMARGLRSIMLNVLGDTTTEIEEGVTVTEENIQSLTDALNRYGDSSVAAARNAGKLINPMQAIASLAKAWKDRKLDEQTLFSISKGVAGQRYYNAFSSLIQNYEMYEAMLEKIAGSAGSAQKEVDHMLDSWSTKAKQLSTAWTELVNSTVSENFIKGLIDGGTAALEFAGNLENLALMAGGAYEAIRSLTSGIKNMRNNTGFGGFNIATMGLSLGITAIGIWKSAYEKNIREMQEAATKAVEESAKKTSSVRTLENLAKRYSEIASGGIRQEEGDLEKLKTLQSELNGLVDDQGKAIDIVNGKYKDTIISLQEVIGKQKESAKETARTAVTTAITSFIGSELNGIVSDALFGSKDGYSSAGIGAGYANVPVIQEWFDSSKYFRVENDLLFGNTLFLKKPDKQEEIIAYYDELIDLHTRLGTLTEEGAKATSKDKTIAERFAKDYSDLANLIELSGDAKKLKEAVANLKELEDGFEEVDDGSDDASSGMKNAADSAMTLADAIKAATDAKTRFDEAMQTSKADAFNDYVTAFKTLQEEMKAGRVNSTAFYASARMLLGDDAYNKTGGTSEGVMAALNKGGSSGTLAQAREILFGEYYNKNGEIFEGAGLIELLRNTKGYSDRITQNQSGGWDIPGLTEADLNAISAEWGGLRKELIMVIFEALDQSDTKGEATAEAVKAEKTSGKPAPEEQSKPEIPERVIEQQAALSQSTEELGNALEQTAEKAAAATETINEAQQETETQEKEKSETPSAEAPDTEQARKNAEEWLELLTSIEEAYGRINTQTVGYSPDLEKLFKDIDKLREEITLNITTGAGTGISAMVASVLAAAITTIEGYAKDGKISVTLSSALTGNLKSGLSEIIDNTQTIEELKAIELAITGDASQLESDVDLAIQKENLKKVVLNAEAETEDAEKKIDEAAEDRNTTIQVTQTGATDAAEQIDEAAKDRTTRIFTEWVDEDGTRRSAVEGKFAQGTRNHPGGLSLVNDGTGPELIVESGRAFIAGGGKPAIVNLEKGAKVFTASETRDIFSGSGIPAYAKGTLPPLNVTPEMVPLYNKFDTLPVITSGGISTGGSYSPEKPEGSNDDGGESGKPSGTGSGSGGGKKTDEKAFSNLKEMVDYIINRIGEGLDEQIDILDKQIEELKLQKEAAEKQNELEERQQAVAEAQKDLLTALSERTVRYLGDDGKWHWMADARNVRDAQEALNEAQKDLDEYQSGNAFDEQILAIEKQKEALQEEFSAIGKAWDKIQSGVGTPTGTIEEMLAAVMAGGTPQEQTGANAVRDYLIGTLLQGGSYKGNYGEALDAIAKATAGSPIMPTGNDASLAALIATGGGLTGSVADALRGGTAGTIAGMAAAGGQAGTSISYNYFVDGMSIDTETANTMTMSEVMRKLTVYAGQ